MPQVPVYDIPTAGNYGYAATADPTAEQTTHALAGGGGGAPSTSTFITTVDESANLPNSKILGTQIIIAGTIGARPAAGLNGRLYFTTDTFILYRDNGAAWVAIGAGLNGGIVPTNELGSGTANNTTFLRGDQTWATPSGASPLTTKGDLYGFDTTNNRIPVGSDAQVLTADSTQALGLKWATSAGGPPSGAAGGDLTGTYPNPTIKASVGLTGSPTAPTQATGDNTTKLATDAFVKTAIDNAIAAVNPAIAVTVATTAAADTSGLTYNNGAAGIGATLTGTANTPITIDGVTLTSLIQRVLVKNDTQSPSGAFNGIYNLTQLQTAVLPPILTRALDYDQSTDINNTGAVPVVSGTVNADTSWLLTSNVTTVGTDPLTYVQFTVNPTTVLIKTNNLSDVSSATTSRTNLGLGTAAVVNTPISIANGGTGQTTQTAAFNALDPLTTKGDVLANNGTDSVRLAVGSDAQVLTADSTQATGLKWAAAGGGSSPLTTKGDVFGHSTVDARIPIGTDNQVFIADSAQALGLKWGTAPIAGGGTGATTAVTAFNALSPLTTRGDILTRDATNNIRIGPTLAGHTPMFDGTDTVMKVIRGQYDAGATVSNTTTLTTLLSAAFSVKAPFTVGDQFRLVWIGTYLNSSGGTITPTMDIQVAGSSLGGTLSLSAYSSSATTRHLILDAMIAVVSVGASGTVSMGAIVHSFGNATTGWASESNAGNPFGPNMTSAALTTDTTVDFNVDFRGAPGLNGAGAANFTPRFAVLSRIPKL